MNRKAERQRHLIHLPLPPSTAQTRHIDLAVGSSTFRVSPPTPTFRPHSQGILARVFVSPSGRVRRDASRLCIASFAGRLGRMRTIQEKRRADRERKRRQRARARAAGAPGAAAVHRALTEALAFAMLTADTSTWRKADAWAPVNMGVVIETAVDILVVRHRFDRDHSKRAVRGALAPRPEHRWPSHVPTAWRHVDVDIGVTSHVMPA